MIPHQELLIDGFFLGGPCDTSISKSVVKSPWDGATIGVAAEAMWAQADAAIDAAHRAYRHWSRTSRQARQQILHSAAQLIQERSDDLAHLMALEIGKPITVGRAEVERAVITFKLAAHLLDDPEWQPIDVSLDPRSPGASVTARREPIGPLFCITPFNWPINLAAHKLAPALAAGNTVVLKGSEAAALTTLALARLLHEAGVPAGVLNAIHCEPAIAERVALDDRIKMVSFTGSGKVGWHLKQICWNKRVSLELGGTATTYVDDHVDPTVVAQKLATSAYSYAGQVCISAQNVFASFDVYDDLKAALIEATEKCRSGNPTDPDVVCGPLINSVAADRIMEWIGSSGGTVVCGGTREKNLIQPTLIESALPQSKLVCEEVFGPILNLQRVDVPSLALVELGRSPYGIHHSVFTKNQDLVEKFLKFVHVGGLIVNDVPSLRFDAMPYGGVKESGFGREGVRYAFEEMTDWKTVVRREAP